MRFILRTIDVFVAIYERQGIRWNEEPFQRASETQKRVGGLFMAIFPISLFILFKNEKFFGAWVDSMMYGRHSIIWFYLVYIGLVCCALLIAFKIAPKIPLSCSAPVAIVAWPPFLWFVWTHFI